MRRAFVALIAPAIVVVSGCTSTVGEAVTTTNNDARAGTMRHMQAIADSLPAGGFLSATLPGVRGARLSALPAPCNQDDNNPEQPYNWSISMWVVLPSGVDANVLRDKLIDDWRERDYSVRDGGADSRQALTSDDYVIALQKASSGELSASVESPCFPKSQLNERISWPTSFRAS